MKSCTTCRDDTCDKLGTDNAACEDWTAVFNGKPNRRPEGETCPIPVVIIGPLTDTPAEYLGVWVRRFCEASAALMRLGYVPLNPAADMVEILCTDPPLCEAEVKARSMGYVHIAAELGGFAYCIGEVNTKGDESRGVRGELALCTKLKLPVVWSLDEVRAAYC